MNASERFAEWNFDVGPTAYQGKSFRRIVREVYLAEHRCKTYTQIAKVMDMSRSQLCQQLRHPKNLSASSVRGLIANIHSRHARDLIVGAWGHECFGDSGVEEASTDADLLERMKTLVLNGLSDRALQFSREALAREHPPKVRRWLFIHAIGFALDLDNTGEAVELSCLLCEYGREKQNEKLIAEGLALKARAIRRAGLNEQEVLAALNAAAETVQRIPAIMKGKNSDEALARDVFHSERAEFLLRKHKTHGGQQEALSGLLVTAEERYVLAESNKSEFGMARAKQLEALVHLGLGNLFKAEDAFEVAHSLSKQHTSCDAGTAFLWGKILAARGKTEDAVAFLHRLSAACEQRRLMYYHRLVQTELAELALRTDR